MKIAKFGILGGEILQRDLNDNATEYLVVGDKTVDRKIVLEYSFEMPIADRAHVGTLTLNHDGTGVVVDDFYTYVPPYIKGVSWGADFSGNNIRLIVITSGIGENPTIKYRRSSIGVV